MTISKNYGTALFLFYLFLPPAASVSPLECDKVTDLDREKNAQRIFPYFVASQYFYFIFFASGGQRFAPGISSSIMQPIFSWNWKK